MNKERLWFAVKDTAMNFGMAIAIVVAMVLFAVAAYWLMEFSLVIGLVVILLLMFMFLVWTKYEHGT